MDAYLGNQSIIASSIQYNILYIMAFHCRLSEEIMAYLFAVRPQLSNERFELKINDARFVGFPVKIETKDDSDDAISL